MAISHFLRYPLGTVSLARKGVIMARNEKYTILYGRLSQEDTKGNRMDDSNSIQNQRLFLEKYAAEHGFLNTRFLYDDGYSGTNFNRPGWQKVMELMEAGQVETLIVKDMSRLGREYLQVGQYTELVFPNYGVRFIAVNDGVDSLYENTNDFTPFRNIMNEFYARDCSRKCRSVARTKAETGARVGSRPPFGYQKDPADPKNHLVPDEDSAPIVQYIFKLCAEGNGPAQIATRLTKEKVLYPSAYYYRKYGVALAKYNGEFPYNWEQKTVSGILENPVYLGHTVNLRYTTISYKNKKRVMHPESEWLRFENTHEAIIDQQTWDIVQEIRSHKKRRAKSAEQNIFSGMLYCMDCGHTLVLHRSNRKGKVENSFVCGAYRRQNQPHCTSSHYIREDDLRAVLLDDLQRVTCFARQNESLFTRHISQKQNTAIQKEITALEREIDSAQNRIEELSLLFKRLYEDRVFGRLPETQYAALSESYLQEQIELKQQLEENHKQLEKRKAQIPNTARFTANAKKYTEITELTAEILHTFIQRIEIGARAEKKARYTTQEIRIIYRDIGILDDIPETLDGIELYEQKTTVA